MTLSPLLRYEHFIECLNIMYGNIHWACIMVPTDQAGGPGSSVGIAAGYRLDRPGIEIPVGARFFAHVQTGPGPHPASCTMGTGYFPGVKRPERGADHPPPPAAEVENE
jgi:hypothetical protein